jgi:hypothetical protein
MFARNESRARLAASQSKIKKVRSSTRVGSSTSVNNVGQDEILHIGTGWIHPLDSDGP